MNHFKIILMAVLLWSCNLINTFAATTAFSASGFSASYDQDHWNLGFEFKANKNLYATALGTLSAGISSKPVHIGLWNSNQQLLASVDVAKGSFVDGLFTFMPINPVSLFAGQDYYVASVGFDFFEWNPMNPVVASGITYIQDAFNYNDSSLSFPSDTIAETPGHPVTENLSEAKYFGGNLQIEAVSEPETGTMLMAGLVLVGMLVRRRNSAQVQI